MEVGHIGGAGGLRCSRHLRSARIGSAEGAYSLCMPWQPHGRPGLYGPVKYPLGSLIGANRGNIRIWIAEFRRDAVAKTGCYRIYFTDVAPTEAVDVPAPMVGLLFRHYPKPELKFRGQNRDIDRAMNLARTHLVNQGILVRTTAL